MGKTTPHPSQKLQPSLPSTKKIPTPKSTHIWLAILSTLLLISTTTTQAQTNNYGNNRRYDRYDVEKYLENNNLPQGYDPQATPPDSTIQEQISVSPEELRKLGVDEEIIKQLTNLNTTQDSLNTIRVEQERKALRERLGEAADSISIQEVQTIIDERKKELINKALSLPQAYVYGHEFFRKSALDLAYNSEEKLHPPEDYILGNGDVITITIWGIIDYNKQFILDKSGAINPEMVGKIFLKGLNWQSAQAVIKSRFEKVYDLNNSDLEVNLSFTRDVSANFVGELFYPGTYRFPALTTVYNALVAINGPDQLGSVRNFYIRRNGKTIKTLDVYQYLTNPDSRQEFYLQDNDYIVVPTLGNVVNISGEVKRPHNYEILDNEMLTDVIKYAGGLKANAFTRTINIKRYIDNKEILIDVNLDSLSNINKDFLVQNGDSIFVYPIPNDVRNYVQVTGAVHVAGRYEVANGDKITSALYKTKGVTDDADMGRAYLIRLNKDQSTRIIPFNLGEALDNPKSPENIQLQNLDTIQIVSRTDFRQDFYVNIDGAVRKPGQYRYAEGLTVSDLLYLSGGMKAEAANNRIEVSRMINYSDRLTGEYGTERVIVKRLSIDTDLSVNRNDETFALQPYDQVFVRTSPTFEEPQQVKLLGEVAYPGTYTLLSKEERILNLINRAGGYTKYAFLDGAKLYRAVDSTGYVLLDLDKASKKPEKSKFNYILAPGDSIVVPAVKNLVTLTGALRHFEVDSVQKISTPFEGKRAKYYVNEYGGGFGKDAKRSSTYVQYPNGKIVRAGGWFIFRRYPKVENGSTIFVDITERKKRQQKREERRKDRDWNKAFETFTTVTTASLTLLILLNQVIK